MTNKVKFYNMTKPIKFRKTRLFVKSIGRTYEVGTERSKYLFNYLLYKLNILKRYTFKDVTEEFLPIPFAIPEKSIETDVVGCTVRMKLKKTTNINEDYFYREKDGSKKITYVLKNETKTTLSILCNTDNIHLKIGDKWFSTSNMPTFKWVAPTTVRASFVKANEPMERTKVRTITYDINPLKLHSENVVGVDMEVEDLTESMLKYPYDCTVYKMHIYLDTIRLTDLMMQEIV